MQIKQEIERAIQQANLVTQAAAVVVRDVADPSATEHNARVVIGLTGELETLLRNIKKGLH